MQKPKIIANKMNSTNIKAGFNVPHPRPQLVNIYIPPKLIYLIRTNADVLYQTPRKNY